MSARVPVRLTVHGRVQEAQVEPRPLLVDRRRDDLGPAGGADVTTIAGLADGDELHPLAR